LSELQTALRNVRYAVNERWLIKVERNKEKGSVEVLTRVHLKVDLVDCDAAPPAAGVGGGGGKLRTVGTYVSARLDGVTSLKTA
jgi:hypothetical protein